MLSLGAFTFMAPAVLIAAAVLPLVWLLLRLTPPAVRRLDFPAARLLFNLEKTERTPARTPPWLLILRMGLLALAILGLADPVLTADRGEGSGPLVMVVDNGWASATQWDARVKAARNLLERADRRQQQVAFLTTAPGAEPPGALQLEPAREALAQITELEPQPWPADRAAAAKQLRTLKIDGAASAIWITDGVATDGDRELTDALEALGRVSIVEANDANMPLVLPPPQRGLAQNGGNRINVRVKRIAAGDLPAIAPTARALDPQGQVLSRTNVSIERGQLVGEAAFDLPPELANRIARFDIEGQASAGATVLADARWQRRPVGVASTTSNGISAPLLEDAYYIHQALDPFAEVRSGTLDELMARPLSVLFMASGGKILDAELPRMQEWVEKGGVLVRFAGPRLDSNVDSLLPVRLRSGGRSFGGALSWEQPVALGAFPDNSPFKDMTVPDDVTVRTQVLAEPTPDLAAKTWARLGDGTPLVTAERRGEGWVILFHVTATPEWSALPLSGLFVDMMRRTIDMSTGVAGDAGAALDGVLAPLSLMDGRGRLQQPGPTAKPLAARNLTEIKAGPETPPGLYGSPANSFAFNLSPELVNVEPLRALPRDATHLNFEGLARERAMKPWLLSAALALLIVDLIVSFVLRGLTPEVSVTRLRNATGAIVLLALLLAPSSGHAAEAPRKPLDSTTSSAILETRLAYVVCGRSDIDKICEAGLRTLTQVLSGRTSAEMAPPAAVDLNAGNISADTLTPYPVLYWRITGDSAKPSAAAAAAISTYLHRGGMVVFDSPEQAGAIGANGSGQKLEDILRTIDIPPLVNMAPDHVLTRSFYLTQGLPGRFVDSPVLVERGSTANDGVSSVIIGGNDWASAWARETSGLPMFAAVPGGEQQRELAYRAGVNMVMYALTGNYKSDQVHLPAIRQRLTQ